MRPHSLILKNFGPFTEEETVSFDNLGEFFLISGKNGSGKTTILDGIMFALFGVTTGSRDEKTLLSHFAKEGDIPQVTLEFSMGDVRYRVKTKTASFSTR